MDENVLIGVPDEKAVSSMLDFYTNKLGGHADLIDPSQTIPKCRKCGKPQALVVQLYCPLEASSYHRSIYVFCCAEQVCWSESSGMQMRDLNEAVQSSASPDASCSNNDCRWTAEDDDWGGCDDNEDEAQRCDERVCDAIAKAPGGLKPDLTSPVVVTPKVDHVTDALHRLTVLSTAAGDAYRRDNEPSALFQCHYVNVFAEHDLTVQHAHDDDDSHIQELLSRYQNNEKPMPSLRSCVPYLERFKPLCACSGKSQLSPGESRGELKLAAESYEKRAVEDRCFDEFAKKVAVCREQVVRYVHGGSPLLLQQGFASKLPKTACSRCGASLAFEFQLMPGLIPFLTLPSKKACVEFGTVLVYTCSRSCWNEREDRIAPEHLVYCPDPDLKFFAEQKT